MCVAYIDHGQEYAKAELCYKELLVMKLNATAAKLCVVRKWLGKSIATDVM